MVGSNAIHIDSLLGYATEEVASSDDDTNLTSERVDCSDLGGYFVDEDRIDAETSARSQGFAGEFEEDSFVHV